MSLNVIGRAQGALNVIKQAASVSSSHLFSLLCLYFSVFHDAKPEWEWTNLLLPERTEWAAAIRSVRTRDGGRDGGAVREGRHVNNSQWEPERRTDGGK
ncbi:hypothetical protein JOQ06_028790 [Pogonophryne albipinna]|uniref:Uncharacterized protein n=1 Tax=Pogonophryne albipinna TaxID=1090488 RepID=A0AAD6BBY0_9TELE|nr:hypothetical protein JOQ06_028790 [Pogonophryne albipinna]